MADNTEYVPSWLNEENISTAKTVASNPAVQAAAKNPAVQAAAKEQVKQQLNNSNNKPLASPTNDLEANSTRAPNDAPRDSEFIIDEPTLKQMQNYHLALRVCYMGAAVFMSAAAVLSLQGQGDLGLAFFACYVFFFSALICCFECALSVSCTINNTIKYFNNFLLGGS